MIGSYVIVRCHDAGVHAGFLEAREGREATLTEARRLWYWTAKEDDFLNGVAVHGLGQGAKIGPAVSRMILTEDCEIIECSETGKASIREYPSHAGK